LVGISGKKWIGVVPMDRFRGSAPASIDEKGRLKIPNVFRRQIEEAFGGDLFVTSIHGKEALVYPLSVWQAIEERLAAAPAVHRSKRNFLERVNSLGRRRRSTARAARSFRRSCAKPPGSPATSS